jgi:hypothetical protein
MYCQTPLLFRRAGLKGRRLCLFTGRRSGNIPRRRSSFSVETLHLLPDSFFCRAGAPPAAAAAAPAAAPEAVAAAAAGAVTVAAAAASAVAAAAVALVVVVVVAVAAAAAAKAVALRSVKMAHFCGRVKLLLCTCS